MGSNLDYNANLIIKYYVIVVNSAIYGQIDQVMMGKNI